jgi:cell division protein FtsB
LAYPDIEPRRRGVADGIFAIVVIALVCYLTFAALQGEHGLFSLFQVQSEEAHLRIELTRLKDDLAALENQTRGLSTDTLDLDLLDERARTVLSLGRPDEIIIP